MTRNRGSSDAGPGVVIRARNVVKEYPYAGDAVHALRGVSVEILAAEWVAIMGPSGCGKSTLLNVLAGIDAPTSGEVELRDQPLAGMTEGERARLRLVSVGFVFQRFHLLAVLTALENIELPMAEAGVPRAERRRRSLELLDYVGLSNRAGHRPPQLSGGEQQRVAIARAVANRPAILFADEPTGELDQKTGEGIMDLFARLNGDGATLVTVTHDPRVAEHAGRTIRMADGEIVNGNNGNHEW
ncbi:MAG: ABC transporter ATP-binding protein [Gemmatimonadetes bacterium]|nr:ABC transporter ATP-binding protein [Gemmatimonadota bacterium]